MDEGRKLGPEAVENLGTSQSPDGQFGFEKLVHVHVHVHVHERVGYARSGMREARVGVGEIPVDHAVHAELSSS